MLQGYTVEILGVRSQGSKVGGDSKYKTWETSKLSFIYFYSFVQSRHKKRRCQVDDVLEGSPAAAKSRPSHFCFISNVLILLSNFPLIRKYQCL